METVGRHCSPRERQRNTETGFWDGDVGRLGTWWMRLEKWAVLGFEHYPLHSSDSLCIQLAFLGDVGTSEGEHIHWKPMNVRHCQEAYIYYLFGSSTQVVDTIFVLS